jgi:CRP-like cAMP-binding protein
MDNPQFDSVLAKKLNAFLPLTANERKCLAEMQSAPVMVKRGRQLTQEGQTGHKAFVLHAGWACSYKDLPNGRRQVISFPIAGDCVGLRSVLLKTADHSFSALTDAVVSQVEGPHIMKMRRRVPTSRDGAAVGCVA